MGRGASLGMSAPMGAPPAGEPRTQRWGLILAVVLLWAGCGRGHQVGDHVLVEWRGSDYPAVIVSVEGPTHFVVHYDGYSEDWDEVIQEARIHGKLGFSPAQGIQPPGRARDKATASTSASAGPRSVYREGERVRVEWHGSMYPATILGVLGDDRYRVHYEGYGNEWDEDVGLNRIQRKGAR
jgi:hypothetical protein